ncbi:adenine-specific DNA methylase [Komagataeibacter diospyri]|uniref:Eco57I restriction-modification methylase domain-containing protein n=1 Tax=Komagataeibacter diospyri TaxID=1932662 RepID=UPI00113C9620|nr:Eco57I restriction-modification methylase domain-containing protein [Komagataeibacter diospyri]GCE90261.1 adenine-specific DNA methylase [Komagataeibacter diospyri]
MSRIAPVEKQRLILQAELDSAKTQSARNKMGQFATPTSLAAEILNYAGTLLPQKEPIRFLDPAIGTGAFYSALRRLYPATRIVAAGGFEIDPYYGRPAADFWRNSSLDLQVADFTLQRPDPSFNMLICNPPYVRHHHMANEEKNRLQVAVLEAMGIRLSSLAGLYCHFLALSHAWMSEGGIAGWLIPSEFMDVNYGQAVKQYLLEQVTLLHIHRFDPNDVQFEDALVSSAVVWFRKAQPPKDHKVKFSFGGTLAKPANSRQVSVRELATEPKWTRFPVLDVRTQYTGVVVSDFFKIRRGIATGDNSFFILTEDEIERRRLPKFAFRPILPSPRYLKNDEIDADKSGVPHLGRRLFLLDSGLPENEIKMRFPTLYAYLQEGRERGVHERYLCRHRSRWYTQEARPPAPIVCTYMGRSDTKNGRSFRFILNRSQATVANVYLAMYPTSLLQRAMKADPGILRAVWQALNRVTSEQLMGAGRVYGGGLHKLEPKELANVPVPELANILPEGTVAVAPSELFHIVAPE